MREEISCALNGVDFAGLDPRLYIQDVEERVKTRVDTADRRGGARLCGCPERLSLSVTLRFMVKERDRAARQSVVSRVNGWAKEGWLTLSTRPGLRLYAHCTQPADSETLRWSGDMQVAFTAFDAPWWQDRFPVTAMLRGAEASAALRPAGTRSCALEADILNESGGTVNRISLAVNGQSMTFEGVALAAGRRMTVGRDERGLLYARVDGEGRLDRRTADSDDGLTLYPARNNTVGFSADGVCAVTLSARGVYD